MDRVMRDKKAICLFLLPSFVLFLFMIVMPIAMSLYYSLTSWDGIGASTFIGLDNYSALFSNDVFYKALAHSILFALASVFIQLPLSLLIALVLASKVKGERFFVTVYFIPVILASVVIGQLWRTMYRPDGLFNAMLNGMGLSSIARVDGWLGNVSTAFVAVLIPILWQYVGYHMLLMYSGIKSIPPEIYEASKIDGASFWQTSFYITIPMLKPILHVCLTFSVIGSMKIYDLIYVLTGGGPAGATEVLSTLLVETIFLRLRYGDGSAMAVILIAECFALYLILNFLFREKKEKLKK